MNIIEKTNRTGPLATRRDPKGYDFWKEGVDLWKQSDPGILDIIEKQVARSDGALRVGFDYDMGTAETIVLNLPRVPGPFLDTLHNRTGINLFQSGVARLVACEGESLAKVTAFEGPKKNREFESWLIRMVDAGLGSVPEDAPRRIPGKNPGGANL